MFTDESQRLMHLLNGGRCDRPPFWEPWFCMFEMLKTRYGNDRIAMSRDLGFAAQPIGGLGIGPDFTHVHEEKLSSGAYYAGGLLREMKQLLDWPVPDYEASIEKLQSQKKLFNDAGLATWMVISWSFDRLSAWMGLENMAMVCYDDPQFMHDAVQLIEGRNQEAVRRVLSVVKPDFVLYNGDCAYKSGPMIDPQMLRDFTFEPSKRTVSMVRDLGIPFAFHTDGKLDEVMPMIRDLGICAVHGCEKQANDLGHLVETFGESICLVGNMDVVFLKESTPEQVRDETLEMLRVGNGKKRFIAATNTSPQDYIPYENYRMFTKTVGNFQS